jgi:hypothetical protein
MSAHNLHYNHQWTRKCWHQVYKSVLRRPLGI